MKIAILMEDKILKVINNYLIYSHLIPNKIKKNDCLFADTKTIISMFTRL